MAISLGIYPFFRQTHLLADSNLCFLGPGDWLHFTAQEVIVGSGTMPTPSVQLFPSAVADLFSISKLWNPMLSLNKFINRPSELCKNDEVPIKLASFVLCEPIHPGPNLQETLGFFRSFNPGSSQSRKPMASTGQVTSIASPRVTPSHPLPWAA
jgi:hypothetical protein